MHAIRRGEAIERDGRMYYLGRDVEVISLHLPPGAITEWHAHTKATEVLYVVSGSVVVETRTSSEAFSDGDVFGFAPNGQEHRVRNSGRVVCMIVTFKTVTDCMDHTHDFQTDKTPNVGRTFTAEPWRKFFGCRPKPVDDR